MFYTYLWLRENGTPYYVGKGSGNRAQQSVEKHRPPKDKERIIVQEFESEDDAFLVEKLYIALWGRKNNSTGILKNLTDGGEGPSGQILSEEAKRKMSESRKGNQNAKGLIHSSDFKVKHSECMKGRSNPNFGGKAQTQVTKEKISKSKMGKPLSKECREKMSKAHIGTKFTDEHKKNLSISVKAAKLRKTQENSECQQATV
jgi:hypothetical protein